MEPVQDQSNSLGRPAGRILARRLATQLTEDMLHVMRDPSNGTSTLLSTNRDDFEDK